MSNSEMTPRAMGRISLMTATALMASMAIGAAPAQAQDIAAAPAAQTGGLEDIVVTARKRAESTQDVPVSVTVLSAEALDRYDMSSLERVSASTPSFVIGRSPSGSGATLVLRGIGSNTTSIGLEQSVAVVVDGVYYGQGRVINEGFFDLGRLEIMKGPQALFFGKNATAGAVSITTADPSDRTEIIGRLGYEFNAQDVVAEAIASGPLSDTLGVRIAVRGSKMFGSLFGNDAPATTYTTTDIVTGTVTNHVAPAGVSDSGKGKELYGRLTLKWQPTDRLTATIKANAGFNNNNNPAASSVIFRCPTGATTANPDIACTKRFVSSANRFPAALTAIQPYARSNGDTGNRYKAWAVTANLNYELDDVTLTSVTNYNYNRNVFIFDADSVAADGPGSNWATEWSDWKAFSSEARLLTTLDSPVNVMVGALYQKTKRNYKAWTAAGGVENSAAPFDYQRYLTNSKLSHTDGETIAAFGQATWKILENLEVAGGVRYTHETKDSDFVQPYSHPLRVAAGIFLPNVTITDNGTYNNWSPEATITYKPSRDITLYGAYKTAYKSGGFSNSGILSPSATIDDFAFGPEKARGFEAGIKTTLLDRQLRLNLGLYTYKFEDLQIDFFNSSVFAFSTINAGSARTKGVELEMEYAPRAVSGLNLRGSLNYNHARYGDVAGAPCYAGQTIAAGCTIAAPGQRPSQNLIGKPTANAPDWAASLGASYETTLTNDINLIVSTDSRYSASYLSSAFANPLTRQDRYINLDASVRLKSIDDRWEFAVIGKNLTNRFYATGGTDAPGTGSGTGTAGGIPADQIGFIASPRTVQAQVTFRY